MPPDLHMFFDAIYSTFHQFTWIPCNLQGFVTAILRPPLHELGGLRPPRCTGGAPIGSGWGGGPGPVCFGARAPRSAARGTRPSEIGAWKNVHRGSPHLSLISCVLASCVLAHLLCPRLHCPPILPCVPTPVSPVSHHPATYGRSTARFHRKWGVLIIIYLCISWIYMNLH